MDKASQTVASGPPAVLFHLLVAGGFRREAGLIHFAVSLTSETKAIQLSQQLTGLDSEERSLAHGPVYQRGCLLVIATLHVPTGG